MLETNIRISLIKEIFEKYIHLVGYCHIVSKGGQGLINDREVKFASRLVLSDDVSLPKFDDVYKIPEIIVVNQFGNNIVENLMNKHGLDVAPVRLFANLRKHNTSIVTQSILKVELLDKNGQVVDSFKVSESAIPKELRNVI